MAKIVLSDQTMFFRQNFSTAPQLSEYVQDRVQKLGNIFAEDNLVLFCKKWHNFILNILFS